MKILHKDNFLTQEELGFCLSMYPVISNNEIIPGRLPEYWKGRYCDISDILEVTKDKDIYRKLFKIIKKVKLELENSFPEAKGFQADSFQFANWEPETFQTVHSDNINVDGTPSLTPWRMFSCVIYLNDDFEGGKTFFPNFNYEIDPVAGRIAMFSCDLEHRHGVSEISVSNRKTLISFWSPVIINKRLQVT